MEDLQAYRILACAILVTAGIQMAIGAPRPTEELHLKLSGRAIEQAAVIDPKCRTESGSGGESFGKFIAGEIEGGHEYKCFIKCVMNELQSMTHEGEFILEEELENIPPEILDEGHRIVHLCKHTTGPDPCETAFQLHKCYHDANPELYRMVLMAWDYRAGVI